MKFILLWVFVFFILLPQIGSSLITCDMHTHMYTLVLACFYLKSDPPTPPTPLYIHSPSSGRPLGPPGFGVNSKSEQIDSQHWVNCQLASSLRGSEWMEALVWTTVPRWDEWPSPLSQKGQTDRQTDRLTDWLIDWHTYKHPDRQRNQINWRTDNGCVGKQCRLVVWCGESQASHYFDINIEAIL